MFIRKENEYMIPVKYVEIDELGFTEEEFTPREMTININSIKTVAKGYVRF